MAWNKYNVDFKQHYRKIRIFILSNTNRCTRIPWSSWSERNEQNDKINKTYLIRLSNITHVIW